MGLFSRKKKAQQEAEAAAATEKARLEAARAAVAAAEAQRRAKEDEEKKQEDVLMNQISAKRKEIDQMLGAIDDFQKRAQVAVRKLQAAKKAKKNAEATVHLRTAKGLEKRIKDYENHVARSQQQLASLEDTAFQRRGHERNKEYIENMKASQLNKDEVEDVLQDMRDAMNNANEVNDVMTADHNLHGTTIDEDDLEDEIGRLTEQFGEVETGEEVKTELPAVPGTMPEMPGTAAPAAASKEEEEIRQLEESMGVA